MPLQIPSPMRQIPVLDVAGAKRAGQRESQQAFLSQLNLQNAMKQGVRSDQKYSDYKKDRKRQEKLNQRTDRLNKMNENLATHKYNEEAVNVALNLAKKEVRTYKERLKSNGRDTTEAQQFTQGIMEQNHKQFIQDFPDKADMINDKPFDVESWKDFINAGTPIAQKMKIQKAQLELEAKKLNLTKTKAEIKKINYDATGGTSPKEQRKNKLAFEKEKRGRFQAFRKAIDNNDSYLGLPDKAKDKLAWEKTNTLMGITPPPATPNPNEGKFQTPEGQAKVAQRLQNQGLNPQGKPLQGTAPTDQYTPEQIDALKQERDQLLQSINEDKGNPSTAGEDASRSEKVQPQESTQPVARPQDQYQSLINRDNFTANQINASRNQPQSLLSQVANPVINSVKSGYLSHRAKTRKKAEENKKRYKQLNGHL